MKKLPRLIGVIHLPSLAGAPGASRAHPAAALQGAGARAVREAIALQRAGFEALILENFGDAPFYKTGVPPETAVSMGVVAAAVRESVRIPVGINVLRNDARTALAIAAVTGCEFIRVNVLTGVVATDQGLIEGDAAGLLRERDRLGADIRIFADVHVKHARTLSSDRLDISMEDTVLRAGADAVIITGETTGRAVDSTRFNHANTFARAHRIPLYIGSGAAIENLPELAQATGGIIVGSALRKGGRAGAELDSGKMRAFVKAFETASRAGARKKK